MVKGRSRALGVMVLAAVLALPGCNGGARPTPKLQSTVRPGVAPTPPAEGAYFGAWVEPGKEETSPSPSPSPEPSADKALVDAVTGFERDMGRRLDITATYRSWRQDLPEGAGKELADGTRYLLLTWSGTDTREIVAGRHDGTVRERARSIKALGKPVFLRWQPNMDSGSIQHNRIHSAADFVAAWKHLRQIFRQERVDNVAWVWCATAGGFRDGSAVPYYPGDDQVDWIATEIYPGADFDYRDFSEAASGFMRWAEDRPKPIMIPEFGVPRSYGDRRAEWLRKAATFLQTPQVKAVVYYDSDEGGADAEGKPVHEYSVAGDSTALSALREMATTPYFNPRNHPVTPGS